MKGKNLDFVLVLALMVICGRVPVSLAIPVTTDVLNYQGAVFTLDGEWGDSGYTMIYTANFDEFKHAAEQPYLKAIDWKWLGGSISSVALTTAPGDWSVRTSYQIGGGDEVGCVNQGGSNAVCAEYEGEQGLSTALRGDLRWVFEISFKNIRQSDVFLKNGVRNAFVTVGGSLASPILSCGDDACSSDIQPGASVPAPGVPALLLVGLIGLFISRRGNCV